MRVPYIGVARVRYLVSMLEHRRLVRKVAGWPEAASRAVSEARDEGGDGRSPERAAGAAPAARRPLCADASTAQAIAGRG